MSNPLDNKEFLAGALAAAAEIEAPMLIWIASK